MATPSPIDSPLLVIVNGPPASGKSTLGKQVAAGLGIPYLAKDDIKEELYDSLGKIERALSGKLGEASMRIMYTVARRVLDAGVSIVIEANFYRGVSEPDLSTLFEHAEAMMIHCEAPEEELVERYAERDKSGERHPVHGDAKKVDDLEEDIEEGTYEPLDLDIPLVRVDTTNDFEPSVAEIISEVARHFPRFRPR